jgi:hypothetical protein
MEIACTPETLINTYKTAWYHNPEDHIYISTAMKTSTLLQILEWPWKPCPPPSALLLWASLYEVMLEIMCTPHPHELNIMTWNMKTTALFKQQTLQGMWASPYNICCQNYRYPSFYEHSIYEFSLQWSILICTYFSLNKLHFQHPHS